MKKALHKLRRIFRYSSFLTIFFLFTLAFAAIAIDFNVVKVEDVTIGSSKKVDDGVIIDRSNIDDSNINNTPVDKAEDVNIGAEDGAHNYTKPKIKEEPFIEEEAIPEAPPSPIIQEIVEDVYAGSEYFETVDLHMPEMIHNKPGTYCKIILNPNHYREITYFKPGEYHIADFDRYLLEALNDFKKTLLNYNLDEEDYDIFILGSADQLGNGTFRENKSSVPQHLQFDYIEFFQKCDPETCRPTRDPNVISHFTTTVGSQRIPEWFNNSHLPNLRAKFLQYKMAQGFDKRLKTPVILDGSVKSQISAEERNAMIILYLKTDNSNRGS